MGFIASSSYEVNLDTQESKDPYFLLNYPAQNTGNVLLDPLDTWTSLDLGLDLNEESAVEAFELAFLSEEYIAPRNAIEEKLVEIWQDLLDYDFIGIKDNFFELGGQSTLSIRLVDRIQKVYGIELPLSAVFYGENIETLANLIQGRINLGN